jgi:hypothetical protein
MSDFDSSCLRSGNDREFNGEDAIEHVQSSTLLNSTLILSKSISEPQLPEDERNLDCQGWDEMTPSLAK